MEADIQLISVFGNLSKNLHGNVSAVVWLDKALTKNELQKIGSDLNQPATTFLWQENDEVQVRWFAPDAEIGLCGHGSLAAVAYLSNKWNTKSAITLNFAGGKITGTALSDGQCQMQINAIPIQSEQIIPSMLPTALGKAIIGYFKTANKDIVLLENEEDVKTMQPNFSMLRESDVFGYAVTAKGKDVDFVSRTIVPHVQQLEDHATGSSHAALVPFWSKRLNKSSLKAIQQSPRGGYFECSIQEEVVSLKGEYTLFLKGKLEH